MLDKTAWDPLACSLSPPGVSSTRTSTEKASVTSSIPDSLHSHDLNFIFKKLSDSAIDCDFFHVSYSPTGLLRSLKSGTFFFIIIFNSSCPQFLALVPGI